VNTPYPALDGLVRVYPADAPRGAGFVWVHGGGFVGGDLDMPEADAVARGLAARDVTVVSVDYRLAGAATRFPAGSDDVIAAWRWVVENADGLGIDASRLAMGGASAGGNLVAGAVLRMIAADDGPQMPAWVLLAYPTLLAVQPEPDAALRSALDADPAADVFTPEAVRRMYEDYLGTAVDDAPLAAVPGRATAADLRGYPPVLMINDEVDELRVSGEVFAETMRAAGRDIRVLIEPGTVHGHLNRPEEPAWTHSIDLIAGRLHARGDDRA
jgi:acetyl esterase